MQPTIRRMLVAAVSLIVILMPRLASAAPSVSADPGSGPAGTLVSVQGAGFTAGLECTLHLGSATLPLGSDPQQVGTCTVDGNSVLTGTFTTPDLGAGTFTMWACNGLVGNLCSHEFEERASTPFTISPPPTTTTTAATTTTTTFATTTTSSTSTTSTTFPEVIEPIDIDVEELPSGYGIGDGLYGPSPILTIGQGGFHLPPEWLMRCGPLSTSTVWSFDDQALGSTPEYPPHRPLLTEVVQPDLGTISLPYAARQPTTEGGWNHRFDIPLRYFGVHVGLPEGTDDEVIVQIEAATLDATFDADRVVLGPDPSPASTCLLVQWPEDLEDMPFVTFRAFTPTGGAVEIDLDDVFFGTDAYPRSGRPEAAEVRFLLPLDGDVVRTTRPTVLLGEVRWPDGLEIDGVRIVRPTWDRSGMDSSLAEITRSWLMEDGVTRRAFFWLDGVYVAPGDNEVAAVAFGPGIAGLNFVNFRGDGPATPPPDAYREAVTGIVDIRPWAMEVTQAIRGALVVQAPGSTIVDDFNHVAGKPTVVRAYGTQQFAAGSTPDRVQRLQATALLHGTRGGATLPGSPLRPTATAGLFDYAPGSEAEDGQRPLLSRTWNFVLPDGWTAAGDVEFRLEVNPASEAGHIEEGPGTAGGDNFITQRVRFTDVGEIRVNQVSVDFYFRCDEERIGLGVGPCGGAAEGDLDHAAPSAGVMRRAISDAWRMMPVPGVFAAGVSLATLRVAEKNPPIAGIAQSELGTPLLGGWLAGEEYDTIKTAWGDVTCPGDLMIFHTSIPWPNARTITVLFNPFRPFGDDCKRGAAWLGEASAFVTEPHGTVFAHEAGHSLGLRHTPGHDEADERARWPGDHGDLGPPGVATYGFDVADMVVIPPADGTHDLMSYGRPRWVSVGTWNHLFDAFVGNAAVGDTRTGAPAGDSDVGSRTDGLVVAGSVNDGGPLPVPELGRGIPLGVGGSELRIELRDAAGNVLASAGAFLDADAGTFSGFVPVLDGAASIVVLRDGEVLGEIVSDGSDIDVALGPLPDLSAGPGRIEWSGRAGLHYLVEASRDGAEWWPLGSSDDPWLDVDPSLTPLGGDGWTIRVRATDGIRAASDDLGGIDFGIRLPVADIVGPADGDRVAAGMVRAAAGINPYVEADYAWFLDGDLVAAGLEPTLPLVAPGPHEIKLVVENPAGRAEAAVSVLVFTDEDADGMDDAWESARGLDPSDPDDGGRDDDGDGLANVYEHRVGSEPDSIDSDGDDYSDGVEVAAGSDPTDPDSLPVWLGFEDPVAAPRISQASVPADGGLPWRWVVLAGGLAIVSAVATLMIVRRR